MQLTSSENIAMRFEWNLGSTEDWDQWVEKIPQSNLLQTWPYAQTMRSTEHMMTRFGVIYVNDDPVGIFQIQEVSLLGIFGTIALDRGPLWFNHPVSNDYWCAFVALFAKTFPKRFGMKRRFLPELPANSGLGPFIESQGFRRKAPGHQTIWLDLRPESDSLRKGLKQKWRNSLNAAQRSGLTVTQDKSLQKIEWLIARYMEDRRARHYPGPSAKIVRNLATFHQPRGEVILLSALKENVSVAALLIFRHGKAATYEIGWTSEAGRETRAHHLLLWHAVTTLKETGAEWFDLGGINPDHAEGVSKFKQGLGGTHFESIGLYT